MGFIKEFKEFATRGNVMELAEGIIIGGAFEWGSAASYGDQGSS